MNSSTTEEYPLRRPSHSPPKPTSTTNLKGPCRVVRLCILTICLPVFLIAGPLYLRYYVYGDQLYPLAISDMRLLDNKVSTTWCQRQLVKVNTTFNAFLLPGLPQVSPELKSLSMVRHLVLEDDMKEYWGFYLLRGSTVTVSTCVRWPGASLIVIRGHKHLHECAYIGDDSSEELDELMESIKELGAPPGISEEEAPSNDPEKMRRHRPNIQFHHPDHEDDKLVNYTLENEHHVEDHDTDAKVMKTLLGQLSLKTKDRYKHIGIQEKQKGDQVEIETTTKVHVHKHRDQVIDQEEKKYFTIEEPKPVEGSEELFQNILKKLKNLGERGHIVLEKLNKQLTEHVNSNDEKLKQVMDSVLNKKEEKLVMNTRGRQYKKPKVHFEDTIDEIARRKRDILISTAMNVELNKDDEKENAAIEEGFNPDGIAEHRGIFNETTLNDRSNSEFWSSFSSSEEALLNCAGLILNLPLTPHRFCEKDRSIDALEEASLSNKVTYRVPSNGYYFFVFNSENEVQKNYIRVQFNLDKAVYNVSDSVSRCSNITGNCALDLDFFSNEKLVLELPVNNNDTLWNQEFVVLSECEPRTSIYIICVVSVPLVILLFAFQ